jgi:hypothetical protein
MLPLAGAALALGIFSATYFEYFSRHEAHLVGSYLPMAIGLGSFFLLIYAVTYLGTTAETVLGRHAKAAGLALVGAIVFFLCLLFLILNTLGA